MLNKKSNAFTLAEVLVTLMIIGVIAAITIPTLKESSDRDSYIALLKKANATAANMFTQLQADSGPVIYWKTPNTTKVPAGARNAYVYRNGTDQAAAWFYKQKMNVVNPKIPASGYTPKKLNGDNLASASEGTVTIDGTKVYFSGRDGLHSFQTADGMYWFPSHGHTNCSYKAGKDSPAVSRCALLVVDVNGEKKPNRLGIDMFVLEVTPDGVIPFAKNDCSSLSGDGYGCAAKFLQDPSASKFIFE